MISVVSLTLTDRGYHHSVDNSMTMNTNTLPRKPRSIRSIKKMNMSNANRSGTISTTEATNTTSVTNTADQYCFINTSYAATSSPNPSSTLHILRNQHFNHESSNQVCED